MAVFPHSHLWFGVCHGQVVVISGPHIQILDMAGNVIRSTVFLGGNDKDALLKSGPIRCAAIDISEKYIATAGDDKKLKVWDMADLKLLSSRELPKKPTAIIFTQNSKSILVSDKFGDVFSYTLHPTDSAASSSGGRRDTLSSHENPSGGDLILGHASLLTSFLLTADEKYIITADRDEHIRVSWYPEGYSIERYCLGHRKYVSAIHIPSFSPSSLISGGGDPVLKIWDWMAGTVKNEIRILDAVTPFIKVRPPKRERGEDDSDGEGAPVGRRGRRRKGKEKKKEKDVETVGDVEAGDVELEADEPAQDKETASASVNIDAQCQGADESIETREIVFVLQKIDTFWRDFSPQIIFSVVGATALFSCPFLEKNPVTDIQSFDFGKPVLDFVVRADGNIWVLLDGEWTENGAETSTGETTMIKLVTWTQERLSEVTYIQSNPILLSLNSTCLLPAVPADLKTLDLYSLLSSMPKNTEVQHNAMDRDLPLDLVELESNAGTPLGKGMRTNKKVLGRLKNKKLLEAQGQGLEKVAEGSMAEGAPLVKKARSETGHSGDDMSL